MSSQTFLPLLCYVTLFILPTELALDISATSSNTLSQTFTTSTDNEFEGATITCTKRDCFVTCNTERGCSRTTVDASSSTNLILTCIGDYACHIMFVFCPSDPDGNCNIDCGARFDLSTCGLMQIFTLTQDSIELNCATSYAITSCENSYIYCSTKSSSSVLTTRSSLQFISDGLGGGHWICATGGCCPFAEGTLDCEQQAETCVIDCTTVDCSNYIIDGTAASHLTVNCDSESGGCVASSIKCPIDGKDCKVDCQNTESCAGISIEATTVDSLQLVCAGNGSCWDAAVYCPSNTDNICSIDCNSDSHRSCYDMSIRANSYYEEDFVMDIDCGSDNSYAACEDTTFGCVIEGKETVDFIWDETESEWKCESEASSYCCPWSDDTDTDTDNDVVSRLNINSSTMIIVGVVVVIVFVVCCIIMCVVCKNKQNQMRSYAMNAVPVTVNRPNPPQQKVMMVPAVQQVVIQPIIQNNIPIIMVDQPLHGSAPVVVNASAPPQYQAIQPQASAPVEVQEEGAHPVTHF